ncbi:zinc finger BED domain-containing protein RICESLEEPER 1-like [Carya illinoinensis]|uniref:zinc finger BED domain-containing protein RICESLEEPER 1-like n=1 Tax=Carya illinoinensis TaxID=32201 RepID=UPI001C723925|nr:zinc finger BED domain-containing protein RICESLEEPER 1-like [Carya illinoinensis]
MGDPVNEVHPVEEYENENSIGISLVEAISDNDGDTANTQAPNTVSTENASIELQTVAYERKKRKRTSDVWNDFVEVDKDGVKQPQCKWCKTLFKASRSSSTTTLRRHLLTCLPYMGSKKKQKVLAVESKEADGNFTVSNFTYDRGRVRELAAHMILYHEYPFSMMEHVVFNKFMSANTPYWEKMSQALAKKELTVHFIDVDWHLQRRVLNFCNVPPPHTSLLIADALEKCFQTWGIENKISSITVDNASSNDVAIRILKDDFRLKRTLTVGGKLFHLQLPSKKLILDVPTRWNSTYLMLDAAIQFKEVFPRYGDRDRCFEWVPTVEEWGQVENVCQLLAIFNEVTNIVSGSDYPTANLFLSEVWRMKDILGKKSRDENEYMKSMPSKSELDNYLEESIYICEEGSDASFDALDWWKTNSLKFRTLSKLARDILATPITTVSSKSTFSAGGRVIDPHRASLSTETVQMLLCGSD